MAMDALTLEQQLSQYAFFSQLTAQSQAQVLNDLQQQALPQGIRLITLATTTASTVTQSSPVSQIATTVNINSVSRTLCRPMTRWKTELTRSKKKPVL